VSLVRRCLHFELLWGHFHVNFMMYHLYYEPGKELFTLRTLQDFAFIMRPIRRFHHKPTALFTFSLLGYCLHYEMYFTKYKAGWKVVVGGTCCLRIRDEKFIGYKSLVGKFERKKSQFEGQSINGRTMLKRVLKHLCV
jgi:hypothetical protein